MISMVRVVSEYNEMSAKRRWRSMSVAMSPVISESCEYKENVAESPLAAGNPPKDRQDHDPKTQQPRYEYLGNTS